MLFLELKGPFSSKLRTKKFLKVRIAPKCIQFFSVFKYSIILGSFDIEWLREGRRRMVAYNAVAANAPSRA